MQHQADIGLTDAQRTTIQQALLGAQQKFMEMQWKMSGEMEKLTRLLGSTPVDEAQALEQLDRILSTERDVKKTQIGLLIRIKNTLTREQQAKLETTRPREKLPPSQDSNLPPYFAPVPPELPLPRLPNPEPPNA